jgi:hypothetical protein
MSFRDDFAEQDRDAEYDAFKARISELEQQLKERIAERDFSREQNFGMLAAVDHKVAMNDKLRQLLQEAREQRDHARYWATFACDLDLARSSRFRIATFDTNGKWIAYSDTHKAAAQYCDPDPNSDDYQNINASDGWKVGEEVHRI